MIIIYNFYKTAATPLSIILDAKIPWSYYLDGFLVSSIFSHIMKNGHFY